MHMSTEEKKINLSVSRRRYNQLVTKKEKGVFLDLFCELSELDRKHAIKLLRKRTVPIKRGRPRHYDQCATELLTEIWKLSGKLCGKLLHPVTAMWLESLKRRETVDPDAERQVLAMNVQFFKSTFWRFP